MSQRITSLLLSILSLAFCAVTAAGASSVPDCNKKCKTAKAAVMKKDNYKARYWLIPGLIKQ